MKTTDDTIYLGLLDFALTYCTTSLCWKFYKPRMVTIKTVLSLFTCFCINPSNRLNGTHLPSLPPRGLAFHCISLHCIALHSIPFHSYPHSILFHSCYIPIIFLFQSYSIPILFHSYSNPIQFLFQSYSIPIPLHPYSIPILFPSLFYSYSYFIAISIPCLFHSFSVPLPLPLQRACPEPCSNHRATNIPVLPVTSPVLGLLPTALINMGKYGALLIMCHCFTYMARAGEVCGWLLIAGQN